jgi:CheY-like chemotaxis protein
MPDGGVLTLTLQGKFLDDVHAKQLSGMKQGHYVLLRVEDTGTGIPLDIQDRIFEPFFTTKEVGKGTGLGLSTCHTIIKNHGGHLHLDSRPGQGTCFSIYLPAEPLTNSGKIPLPRPRIVGGRGELLLVVEDEEGIRKITARTLERAGYRVLLACDGAEAVSLYEQHRGEIAAVLIDMSMPVQDGPATIAALRAIHPGVKILATSGLGLDDRVIEALGPDLRNFLPKPYTSETLLAELNRMLRSG